MIRQACALQLRLVLFGPPGFLWKLPSLREAVTDLGLNTRRMRLCHFGCKFDRKNPAPSGSYIQVMTNQTLPQRLFSCTCPVCMDKHVLDWYGKTQDHGDWRRQMLSTFCIHLCKILVESQIPTLFPARLDRICIQLKPGYDKKKHLKRTKKLGLNRRSATNHRGRQRRLWR